MKPKTILFAHDRIVVKNQDTKQYYSYYFSYDFWNRYLKWFDFLYVAVRTKIDKVEDPGYNKISGPKISVDSIPNISGIKQRVLNYRTAKSRLESLVKEVDAVVVRLPSEIGLLTYKIARKFRVPVAIELVGCPRDAYYYHGSLTGKIYSFLALIKYKKAVKYSEYTLYVTDSFLQKRYPTLGYQVNVSNVNIKCKSTEEQTKKIQSINNEQEEFKIGMIGSLNVKYKGLDTAIKALSVIKKESRKKITLEVVGEGNRSEWDKLAKKLDCLDSINFVGELSSNKINTWLETLDIYIQPSKTEGLPRALIEAMNVGCFCIGSTAGGIPELLSRNYLHKPCDYQELAKIVLDYINNPESEKQQIKTNFRKIQRFDSGKLELKRNEFYKVLYKNT